MVCLINTVRKVSFNILKSLIDLAKEKHEDKEKAFNQIPNAEESRILVPS